MTRKKGAIMKEKKFGQLVKTIRELEGESREDLAERLGCTSSFIKHLESSHCVSISDRILKGLQNRYRTFKNDFAEYAKIRNKKATY